MQPLSRGDIYYFDWDGTGVSQKDRPSLVVQNNGGNRADRNPYTIIVAIHHETGKKLPITVSVSKGIAGLAKDSVVDCGLVYTIEKSDLLEYVGHLPDEYMRRVDNALRKSFQL